MTAFTLWLTGIPGSGKTTLARLMVRELRARGVGCELLDGEELRKETPDLGFTFEERRLHIQRAVALAQPVLASGRVALMAFVSPHRPLRVLARRRLEVLGPFVEVRTRCSSAMARDRKPALYRRVHEAGFYEGGEPELVLDTGQEGPDISVHRLVRALEARGLLERSPGPLGNSLVPSSRASTPRAYGARGSQGFRPAPVLSETLSSRRDDDVRCRRDAARPATQPRFGSERERCGPRDTGEDRAGPEPFLATRAEWRAG